MHNFTSEVSICLAISCAEQMRSLVVLQLMLEEPPRERETIRDDDDND